ncbi:MAG TPA: glycerate kinase [Chthoniobacteraceae bacterium]|nr:glycerate kinase [Chthoniobacteraceae bacterium]
MRVLLAPDKFKGSLAARDVAEAVAKGMASAIPGLVIDCCPVADGGEGFAAALSTHWDEYPGICDPLGRPVTARHGWLERDGTGTAVIEMSEASGYHRLTAAERNPWRTTTHGTGQLMSRALDRGANTLLVGLGGSATNDAGAGMAAALGWKFLTSDGEPLEPRPENFLAIERILPPEDEITVAVIAASDVRNPLLGPEGCSRVYARQKGADDRMIEHLETAVSHLADLVAEQLGIDYRHLPGAGAAGGLGYGLASFCGAELKPGFSILSQALGIEERIAACDMVITGEGRLDAQTAYGKAPAELARLARGHGKPVVAVCGQCEEEAETGKVFDLVVALATLEPDPARSMRNAAALLRQAGERIADWAVRRTV